MLQILGHGASAVVFGHFSMPAFWWLNTD